MPSMLLLTFVFCGKCPKSLVPQRIWLTFAPLSEQILRFDLTDGHALAWDRSLAVVQM